MGELDFIYQTFSFIFLLTMSTFTYVASKRINLPYTVLLVIVWLLLVPISHFQYFWFIDDFKLSPDVLLFVFLPVLLFEWAYNVNYKLLLNNWKIIGSLSIISLLISGFFVWGVLYYLLPFAWFNVPFLVCLLFWSLISSTDPVAILSIFRKLWAPKRLTMIFDWESQFNDGASVAFFLVVLWLILEWWHVSSFTYFEWVWQFFSMFFWWIIFWLITWVLFSKILENINNNEEAEIVLTMIVAHFTFISSELISRSFSVFPISWVIATVIASMVIWNYWKFKITPRVEVHMHKFWQFFAFITDSIIFVSMWFMLTAIDIDFSKFFLPVVISTITVLIARTISVYIPIFTINVFKLEEHIPYDRAKLLSWWCLRWALEIVMVMLIPGVWDPGYYKILEFQQMVWWTYAFSIKDFLMVLTICNIMFTLFVQAPLIPQMIKQLKIDKLNKNEEFEYDEWKILTNLKVIEKLNSSYKKAYITKIEYDDLLLKYTKKLNAAVEHMKFILWESNESSIRFIRRTLTLHALWIEKQYLKELFLYNEIEEDNYKYILRKIDREIEKVDHNHNQLNKISDKWNDYDIFSNFFLNAYEKKSTHVDSYIRNRTRLIITRKVIKELRLLEEIDFWYDKNLIEEIIEIYALFNKEADEQRIKLFIDHKATINAIESNLINKSLMKLEEWIINDLLEKEMITDKLHNKFMEDIENEMYSDVKTIL